MPGLGGLMPRVSPVYKQFMVRASVVAQEKEVRTRGVPFFRHIERFDKITFRPDQAIIEAARQDFGGIYDIRFWGGVRQHVFPDTYELIFPEAEGRSTEFAVGTDVIITFGYYDGRESHINPSQTITIEKIENVASITAFR